MTFKSVKTIYAAAAAALFCLAFASVTLLSISVVRDGNLHAQTTELANASAAAKETLTALNTRISTYQKLVLARPDLAQAVLLGDRVRLEALVVQEFKTFKAADPVLSTLEVTDARGIVLIRGHNPKTFGDNKSSLKDIAAALEGRSTQGLAVSPTSGQAALDAVAPIMGDGGKVIGTLKMGAYATTQLVEEVKHKTGADIITLFKGKVTASTLPKDAAFEMNPDMLATVIAGTPQTLEFVVGGAPYRAEFRHMPSVAGEGLVIGAFVASAPYLEKTSDFIQKMLMIGLLSLPVVLVVGFAFGHVFGRPLVKAAGALSGLARGEAATLADYEKSGTEIGDMARAFKTLQQEVMSAFKLRQTLGGMPIGVMTIDRAKDWRIDYINAALFALLGPSASGVQVGAKASEQLAATGLDDQALESLPPQGRRVAFRFDTRDFMLTLATILAPDGRVLGAMIAWEDVSEKHILAEKFETTVKGVVDAVNRLSSELRTHARSVQTSASATLVQTEAVARSSEENSVSVTTMASAAEELAASVHEIAGQIGQSSAITHQAADQSRLMVGVVQELQGAASRIGAVVQLIGSIASQTNLLALNATIEAARAGEAGRGFAVVASEVKALASQTAKAAEEVVAQVESIQSKTGEAVDAIGRINTIIGTVSELSMRVAAAVEQQRNATHEIARNTQQTAAGTHEVAHSITEVSTTTRDMESASTSMLGQADQLQTMVESLNAEVEVFFKALAA